MKTLSLLALVIITVPFCYGQEIETLCDDFTSPLWEPAEPDTIIGEYSYYAEGSIAGYFIGGTEVMESDPIYLTGDYVTLFRLEQGYTLGNLEFNFNSTEQLAEISLTDGWGWGYHDLLINGTTSVSLEESFPMEIDGFSIDVLRDTLISGAILVDLIIEGFLETVAIEGAETFVTGICVTGEFVGVNISEIDATSELQLYPNPAENKIQIRHSEIIENIAIYNLVGDLMLFESMAAQNTELDISNLNIGVYLIQVTLEDGKQLSQKLVKE